MTDSHLSHGGGRVRSRVVAVVTTWRGVLCARCVWWAGWGKGRGWAGCPEAGDEHRGPRQLSCPQTDHSCHQETRPPHQEETWGAEKLMTSPVCAGLRRLFFINYTQTQQISCVTKNNKRWQWTCERHLWGRLYCRSDLSAHGVGWRCHLWIFTCHCLGIHFVLQAARRNGGQRRGHSAERENQSDWATQRGAESELTCMCGLYN